MKYVSVAIWDLTKFVMSFGFGDSFKLSVKVVNEYYYYRIITKAFIEFMLLNIKQLCFKLS